MKIAVVGSGISGIASAWLLSKDHQVTLIEKDERLGGHSHTVDVTIDGTTFPVDTGFLVHNDQTYPHLIKFFEHLGIQTAPSEMTLGIEVIGDDLEWGGENLSTVFAQKRNYLRPGFWKMIRDILKMNKNSAKYLAETLDSKVSLKDFITANGFSAEFVHWYLMPMGASIWSTPTEEMLRFPAHTFIQFCINHSLLQLENRPQWKTVVGGSRRYVQKACSQISEVRTRQNIHSIKSVDKSVEIDFGDKKEVYDAVIMATHAPISRGLIADLTPDEQAILGCFKYQPNVAYLHSDIDLLPKRRKVWSAWNFRSLEGNYSQSAVSVSYLLNKLQPLPVKTPVIVSLNPPILPNPEQTMRVIEYAHPVFDYEAIEAQKNLRQIQGRRGIYYAGAWTRYGFHEDGILSAVNVASYFGVKPPWA